MLSHVVFLNIISDTKCEWYRSLFLSWTKLKNILSRNGLQIVFCMQDLIWVINEIGKKSKGSLRPKLSWIIIPGTWNQTDVIDTGFFKNSNTISVGYHTRLQKGKETRKIVSVRGRTHVYVCLSLKEIQTSMLLGITYKIILQI